MAKETLVIADIHGCLDELKELLKLVKYEKNRYKLIFLGDYVDRGIYSKEVIDLLIEIKKENDETVFLLGNHDDWFLSYLNGTIEKDSYDSWAHFGGLNTLKSYIKFNPQFSNENITAREYILRDYPSHVEFLESLEYYHEDEHFYYAHGGCKTYLSDITKNEKNDFIWPNRKVFFNEEIELDKTLIVGHTIVKHIHGDFIPYISSRKDKIGIDGGMVFDGVFIGMLINNENGEYKFEIYDKYGLLQKGD